MNMLLHGVKDNEFNISHGDSLTNEWDILRETNPAKKMHFDAIVANPPFSLPVEKNSLAGKPITVSICPSLSNFLRISASAPPRNKTPCGRMIAIVPSSSKKGIPVCILVLKKCRKSDDVLFINASEHFTKDKRQNRLDDRHIDKIVDTYWLLSRRF
jgi:type I restriction enzyme M protein